MSKIIKAPGKLEDGFLVFLAGSVAGDDWRGELMKIMADRPIIFLDPRRDDWDDSWRETADDPKFREQVEWELTGLEKASVIVLYFDSASESPISLLEFGLFADSGRMVVCCPEDFPSKGNVDIVCERYGIEQAASMDELVNGIILRFSKTDKGNDHDAV